MLLACAPRLFSRGGRWRCPDGHVSQLIAQSLIYLRLTDITWNMGKRTTDPWHYSRHALAQRYLDTFELGLESARGIFAKRRMGKTEFLKKDLIPAAEKAGYLTAYANLWDNKDNPAAVLVEALALTVEPQGLSRLWQGLNAPVKKVKVGGKVAGMAEGAVEAELAEAAPSANTALSTVMRALDKTGKKLLLAIDEAQVLAWSEHSGFAHALRAALDVRKASIKVIFAGSSESTLRRMFARSSEPFYNWAPLEPFELLGEKFVEAMATKVNALTKYPLQPKEAMNAFAELHNTPDFFRRFLNRYLTHAQLGVRDAIEATKENVFNDSEFVNYWKSLLPADKEVLTLLAAGVSDLHGIAARTQIAAALGKDKPVPLSVPQHALKRLITSAVLTRLDQGEYRFEDEAFAQWVRNAKR